MRYWLGLPGVLRDAAGAGDGGGAGAGAGAGDGDKGGAPQFEPTKYKAEVMGEVTKMLNGGLSRIEKQLAALKPAASGEGDGGDKGGEGDKGDKGAKNPDLAKALKEIQTLTKTVETERAERIKATETGREKERLSLIRTEIAKHGLADHSIDDAFRFFRDEVKYTDSGDIVGGPDEQPLADFVKSTVEKRSHWLPPVAAGGAGASAGRGGKGRGVLSVDEAIALIKPNMSKEDDVRVRAALEQGAAALK